MNKSNPLLRELYSCISQAQIKPEDRAEGKVHLALTEANNPEYTEDKIALLLRLANRLYGERITAVTIKLITTTGACLRYLPESLTKLTPLLNS